ncbi:uncharacterized protein LOC129753780 [Uranotaenia lowii]|uniref:uncharacterized protein LOC129753780 n=1 Tax=Uranotaenia lowii TaxID=190385 RepID=UPI00247ABE7B|nr:uncharacterized protein LOC129753780 [Uranotaenia lowii]
MSFLLKYWFNIENIYQTIGPICRCMKWFGSLPFSLVQENRKLPSPAADSAPEVSRCPRLLAMRPLDVLLLLFWQCYILFMLWDDWTQDLHQIPMSKIMIYFTILTYGTASLQVVCIQLWIAYCRPKIEDILRKVQLVDDMLLQKTGKDPNYRKQHLWLVAIILGSLVITMFVIVAEITAGFLFWDTVDRNYVQMAKLRMAIFYYAIRLAEFSFLVISIIALLGFRSRFRMLTDLFRCGTIHTTDKEHEIRFISSTYDVLVETLQAYNDVFSYQLAFEMMGYIIFAIFTLFSIGSWVANQIPVVMLLALFYGISTIHYTMFMVPIFKIGNDIQNEGKRMAVLVHRAINQSSLTTGSIDRLRTFSRQLQHQQPVVSCGMFSFDWTLCFSVISSAATYTMIMVQFELAVPKFFIGGLVEKLRNDTSGLD